MSKIVVGELEGPSTTSNKITIASGSQLDIAGSPDGSSAINLAVDAGDITTGTIAGARLPAGHIVQVVTNQISSETSYNSTSFEDTFITLAITPQYSNSRILIHYTTIIGNNDSTAYPTFQITRAIAGGATTALTGDWDGERLYYGYTTTVFCKEDAPATTNATTYTLQMKTSTGAVCYIGISTTISYMSLIEVKV